MRTVGAVCALGCASVLSLHHSQEACRDRFAWPFSVDSIWNSPIGSNATFFPAGIFSAAYGPPSSFHNDQVCRGTEGLTCRTPPAVLIMQDIIVRASQSDPQTNWIDQGAWDNGDMCEITGAVATQVPLPADLVIGCHENNNAMALLMPDNRTLVQMQPAYRSTAGAPLLARYHAGCPVPFPWTTDILGDGTWGAHGGSGLSSIGGTIRAGELSPGAPPLRHALKLELFAHMYYFSNGSAAPYSECFSWPALGCDGYAHDRGNPQVYNGTNPWLKPGALLAIPPASRRSVHVQTAPGAAILAALADFGGYIVDDTANNDAALCMESAVSDALLADYGIHSTISDPARPGVNANTTAFYNDLVAVFRALAIVTNNANGTVGGGGVPVAPTPPPICDAP